MSPALSGMYLYEPKPYHSPLSGNQNLLDELLCKCHLSKQLAKTVMDSMLIGEQFASQQHILL
jgi:hypothetical protein